MNSGRSILDEIVAKRTESFPQRFSKDRVDLLQNRVSQVEEPRDFYSVIASPATWGLIAEIKAKSPSKGVFLENPDPSLWAKRYERAGASAISIVTEENYFSGKLEWIRDVKRISKLPVLRKDFLTTSEDILESRAMGADAVLLIAAILNPNQLKGLIEKTFSYGMEPLAEIHNEEEAYVALKTSARLIGINNRNLNDFSVSLETTQQLLPIIKERNIVCESGIYSSKEIKALYAQGVKAFLVGEAILTSSDPDATLADLLGKSPIIS